MMSSTGNPPVNMSTLHLSCWCIWRSWGGGGAIRWIDWCWYISLDIWATNKVVLNWMGCLVYLKINIVNLPCIFLTTNPLHIALSVLLFSLCLSDNSTALQSYLVAHVYTFQLDWIWPTSTYNPTSRDINLIRYNMWICNLEVTWISVMCWEAVIHKNEKKGNTGSLIHSTDFKI